MYCHLKSYSCTSSGTRILPESRNIWQYPTTTASTGKLFKWQYTELRFVHFLSDFFKAGTGEQDIQNPKKVWKVTCKIARVFAEICRFYQKVSLKWPHFTHKVTPFFPSKIFFSRQKWVFGIFILINMDI